MRKLMLASAVFFSMLFIAPVWSHHPAEGIVSDEIWDMVDTLLDGTPHLSIDFDNVMDSMGVDSDSEGNLYLTTTIVVYTIDAPDPEALIDMVVETINFSVMGSNKVPSGSTDSGTASTAFVTTEPVVVQSVDPEFSVITVTEITLWEPVGEGKSQDGMDPKKRG